MQSNASPRFSPALSASELQDDATGSPAQSWHSPHNSPQIPPLSLENPIYGPGEHAGHALRRTFSDLQQRKETEVERSLSGQVHNLTSQLNELEARLDELNQRPTHEMLESTIEEKKVLAQKIEQISINLEAVQDEHYALLAEKQERMGNAAIGKQKNLDRIAELKDQLHASQKMVKKETARANNAEQAVVERDARIKELESRLTRQGKNLKVANTAVDANKAEKAKATKDAFKIAKSETKEESQTIQSLREKIIKIEAEANKLKGLLSKSYVQINNSKESHSEEVNSLKKSKENAVFEKEILHLRSRFLVNLLTSSIEEVKTAYSAVQKGDSKSSSQNVDNLTKAILKAIKGLDEHPITAYTTQIEMLGGEASTSK